MKLIVNQHRILIDESSLINEKEINVENCEFEFSEEITNDYVKEAYFTLNDDTYKVLLENDKCNIPSEVLVEQAIIKIGVVAYKVENEQFVKRFNPTPISVQILEGSLRDAENTEPITPSDKEQIEQLVTNALDEANTAVENANTALNQANNLDLDVSKEDKTATVSITKKDGTQKSVNIFDGVSLQFMWQGTSLGVKTDDMQDYVFVDLQGIQGQPGPQGEAFQIKKTYATTQLMIADYDNMNINDYVMISGDIETQDNATLWVKTETEDPTYRWVYLADFSGASGIQGETGATPQISIGTVTSGQTPSVTISGTAEHPVFNFVLQPGPQGDEGPQGETGDGIASIVKTGTSGLVDTYTITFTNGNTFTYDVTNGADGSVTDVKVNGVSVVDNGVANIEDMASKEELDYYKTIYNVLPKVNGNGESITLNNTGESILKLDPRGQCKQDSTTGKNIFDLKGFLVSSNATFTENADGSYTTRNTQKLYNEPYVFSDTDINVSLSGIVTDGTATNARVQLLNSSNVLVGEINSTSSTLLNKSACKVRLNWTTTGTFTLKNVMIESGASVTDYEPYTNGASPNPSYPQRVKVVSGDNEVVVDSGDALQDITLYDGYISSSDVITSASNWKHSDYIDITDYDYYIVEGNQGTNPKSIIYNANKSPIQVININYNSTKTWNLKSYSGAKYLRISTTTGGLASHHLIQRSTYELDLGVDNLFTSSIYNDIDVSGNAQLQENGYYEVKFSSNKTLMEGQFKANTQYTISAMAYGSASGNSGVIGFNYTDNTSETKGINQTTPYLYTITSSAGKTIKNIKITYGSQNTTYIKDLQLEEGTKANSYTPYGQTPIKMRGIGTYEDYFVRNSGKNLFDESQLLEATGWTKSNGVYSGVIDNFYSKFRYGFEGLTFEANTQYTISLKGYTTGGTPRIKIVYTDNTTEQIEISATSLTAYTKTSSSSKTISSIQADFGTGSSNTLYLTQFAIEKGTSVIYEPYGTGQWCKYNAIGKTLVTIGNTVTYQEKTAGVYAFGGKINSANSGLYCNKAKWVNRSLVNANTNECYDNASNVVFVGTSTDTLASLKEKFDGSDLCYILDTPYLSLIESQTLINQLDKLERALGKDGQTNISQVNNDTPFKIYASALRSMTDIYNL